MIIDYVSQNRPEILAVQNGFQEFCLQGFTNRLYQDATQLILGSFQVGDVKYVVNKSLHANYEPPIGGGMGRFVVSELVPLIDCLKKIDFIGRGKTLKLARQNWENQVDYAIQHLLSLQDFERTPDWQNVWKVLGTCFDLNEIRYSIPLKVRSIGTLEGIRGHRYKIRWLDGRKSKLNRKEIPCEMVSLRPGQVFEAVLVRDARSWRILKILSAFATGPIASLSKEDATNLLRANRQELKQELSWD